MKEVDYISFNKTRELKQNVAEDKLHTTIADFRLLKMGAVQKAKHIL